MVTRVMEEDGKEMDPGATLFSKSNVNCNGKDVVDVCSAVFWCRHFLSPHSIASRSGHHLANQAVFNTETIKYLDTVALSVTGFQL